MNFEAYSYFTYVLKRVDFTEQWPWPTLASEAGCISKLYIFLQANDRSWYMKKQIIKWINKCSQI